MTYQIITLDEKKKSRAIWFTFSYPANVKSAEKIISFFEYLKNGTKTLDGFFVHELETGKAVKLSEAYSPIIEKLKNFPARA